MKAPAPVASKVKKPQRSPDASSDYVIDLDSLPERPTVIVLDPDDTLNDSLDDKNYEISVKLMWNGEVERHTMKQLQGFGDLMQKLAAREGAASVESVVLMKDEKILKARDTADSIGYRITDILTGRVMHGMMAPTKKKKDKSKIKVRIQADGLKRPVEIEVDKGKKFQEVLEKCAEVLNEKQERIKLVFDGENVDLEETPTDLDFEGGEMLDCVILKVV